MPKASAVHLGTFWGASVGPASAFNATSFLGMSSRVSVRSTVAFCQGAVVRAEWEEGFSQASACRRTSVADLRLVHCSRDGGRSASQTDEVCPTPQSEQYWA